MTVSRPMIMQALATVPVGQDTWLIDVLGSNIELDVTGDRVAVALAVPPDEAQRWEPVRARAEAVVAAIPGVARAIVSLTAQRTSALPTPAPRRKPTDVAPPPRFANLRGVKHIIAVASGKGGVGKSTTACNLALALKFQGLSVGVLDADIYGPSMPKLFNLKGRPTITEGRTLMPLEAYGCKVMSIGFVVDADKAMVWRGPMVASAITQMLRDIAWGELDVLIVDMPPGTGDAQLTLAQQAPLAGAVIVSTPQDLALIDARRGVEMFRSVGVPIIGLVENMSYFVCDGCGRRHHIFSNGGARTESTKLGVPFLGEIPLDALIRERSDSGMPIVMADPDGAQADAYRAIAAIVFAGLN
jgi:ATP-binding protein involved in chromosome partitioning